MSPVRKGRVSMAADAGAHGRFGAIVQVLKECVRPVRCPVS